MAEEYRLQLFADEARNGLKSTGVTVDAAGRQTGAMAEGNGAGIPEAGQDATAATEETFDSLIAGRYKQDFQNRVHSINAGKAGQEQGRYGAAEQAGAGRAARGTKLRYGERTSAKRILTRFCKVDSGRQSLL